VEKVEVNLANEKAAIEYDATKITIDSVEQAIKEIGYKVVYEKIALKVGGISDLSDSGKIEKNLNQIHGIKSVSVNYGNSQINVEYNPALISTTDVKRRIGDIGYEILSETIGESAKILSRRNYAICSILASYLQFQLLSLVILKFSILFPFQEQTSQHI
jgi:P-type Cu+ transporter